MTYTEVSSCVVSGVEVKKLRSTRTGLTVCLAGVEGPLVNGYFCLATEAHDHDGLPHTLEHLVFMGSEKYPYKGVLDLLSNRCLAQGTNAWTDVDHTCYTVTTAGSEGFLNLLPIYLDHILYPTLTDAAYTTEVHHITGTGEDAGVVYCEMQARENAPESLSIFNLFQDVYPGRCGYKSETGGLMRNLRESTSNQKVKDYHASYYRHDNLCLIVTGQVSPEALFNAIQPFEDKIISKGSLPAMTRPWQSPVPPLSHTVTREIPFPTDETEDGILRVGVRGPSALDRYGMAAAGVLMEYLSETPVAPLQRDLVEIEDPFCSDVQQTIVENREVLLGFTLSGVPVDKLKEAPKKVFEVLEKIANGTEAINKERMTAIVKRQILNIRNQVEEVPHDFFAFTIIGDFLFGNTPEDFPLFLDQEPRLQKLLGESPSFWTELMDKYFIQGPNVTISGHPSAELAVTMETEEKGRVKRRVNELGEGGLKEKATILEEACRQNEIAPPSSLVSSLSVPSTSSIVFHPLAVVANYMTQEQLSALQGVGMDVGSLPFMFQLNQIHSGFVQLTAILDTAALSKEERLYLPLYQELLFESPLTRDGEVIPYQAVIDGLMADTVQYGAGLGLGGGRFKTGQYSQALFLSVKVEVDKYILGVSWLRDLLYNVQFTWDRVGVVCNKMLNDIPRLKRKGAHVVRTLHKKLLFNPTSNPTLTNMATQQTFLSALKDQPEEQVLAEIAAVRDRLVSPDNLRVVMGTDVNRLGDPLGPWKNFVPKPSTVPPAELPTISPSQQLLEVVDRALVAGVTGVESNFLIQSTTGVDSYTHHDYPAMLVFMEYLCALEGPMWRQIRGMGLSYHYSMSANPESSRLTFVLYKSSQLVQAYEVAKEIMTGFLSGATPFEQVQLEGAVSGVIYETIEQDKTVASCEQGAGLNYLRQLPQDYNRTLLSKLSEVTIDDLKRVGELYFSRLFDHAHTTTAVCCNPSKVDEVKEGLERSGLKVDVLSNLSELSAI